MESNAAHTWYAFINKTTNDSGLSSCERFDDAEFVTRRFFCKSMAQNWLTAWTEHVKKVRAHQWRGLESNFLKSQRLYSDEWGLPMSAYHQELAELYQESKWEKEQLANTSDYAIVTKANDSEKKQHQEAAPTPTTPASTQSPCKVRYYTGVTGRYYTDSDLMDSDLTVI